MNAPRGGYILLEVMLATAIFAMAGVSLALVLRDAITAGLRVRQETHVVWALESRLNEACIKRIEPGTETSKPDAGGVVYETQIRPVNMKNAGGASLGGMYDIKVTARWEDGNQGRDSVAQVYVYQP
jgi:type II secretory pathway pseudopilin PulG